MARAGQGRSAPSRGPKAKATSAAAGADEPATATAACGAEAQAAVGKRLQETEAENEALRRKLEQMQSAEALRAADARLKQAEAENEALKQQLGKAGQEAAAAAAAAKAAASSKMARVRLAVAREAKDRGNEALRQGRLEDAAGMYGRGLQAIEPLEKCPEVGGDEVQDVVDLEVALQLNLAHVSIKQEHYWAALEAADTVLGRQPGNSKALYRRGVALAKLGQPEGAAADFEEVLRQGPNAEAQRELRTVRATIKAEADAANAGKGLDAVWRSAFASEGPARSKREADEERENAATTCGPSSEWLDGDSPATSASLTARSPKAPVSAAPEPTALSGGAEGRFCGHERETATAAHGGDSSSSLSEGGAVPEPARPAASPDAALPGTGALLPPPPAPSEESRALMHLMRRTIACARESKAAGKKAYELQQMQDAAEAYAEGLQALRSIAEAQDAGTGGCAAAPGEGATAEIAALLQEALELEVDLHANMTMVCLSRKDFEGAVEAADEVLRRRPSDAQALHRRSLALQEMGKMGAPPPCPKVEHAAKVASGRAMAEPERCTKSRAEVGVEVPVQGETSDRGIDFLEVVRTGTAAANQAKELGNAALKAGQLDVAAQQYARGLKMVEVLPLLERANDLGIDLDSESEDFSANPNLRVLKEAADLGVSLQLNLALVGLRRKDFEGAIEAATAVLKRRPLESKALYRRGLAQLRLRRVSAATRDFQVLISKEPGMAAAVQAELEKESDVPGLPTSPPAGEGPVRVEGTSEVEPPDDSDDEKFVQVTTLVDSEEEDDESWERVAAREAVKGLTGAADALDQEAKASGSSEAHNLARLTQTHEQAQALKASGNEHFKRGNFAAASCCYSQGAAEAAHARSGAGLPDLGGGSAGLLEELEQLEVSMYLNNSLCQLRLGNSEAAADAAEEALKLQPSSAKGLFRRAQANAARARPSDASAAAPSEAQPPRRDQAAVDSPFAGMFGDPKALRERQRVAREKRISEELTRFREAGNTSHREGDYRGARDHYTSALALDANSTQLLLNRAAARLMLEDYSGGLEDCQRVMELQPSNVKAYARGAKCLQLQGDFAGADALLERGLGAVTEERRELEAQRQGLQEVLRAIRNVEKTLAANLEGVQEGRRAFRLVEDLTRLQAPPAVTKPLRLRALLQSRDLARAVEVAQLSAEVLRASEAKPEHWYWRALALLMSRDRAGAKEALKEVSNREAADCSERPVCGHAAALAAQLERVDTMKDQGNRLFNGRQWEEAVECWEEALRACTLDRELAAVLHTNICASLRRLEQRSEEALKHAQQAVEANPRYAKAFFRRGVLHYDAGRWTQGYEDFKRASQLEPHLQGIDVWLRRGLHAARESGSRKNHYRELGLLCECEQDEVKRKYRQLARECHPDKVRDATQKEREAAETRFKAVNEAHEVLGNVKTRKEYDFGEEERHDLYGFGGFRGRATPRQQQWSRASAGRNAHGFGGFGGFGSDSDGEDWF